MPSRFSRLTPLIVVFSILISTPCRSTVLQCDELYSILINLMENPRLALPGLAREDRLVSAGAQPKDSRGTCGIACVTNTVQIFRRAFGLPITQPENLFNEVVARLEQPGSNPRYGTTTIELTKVLAEIVKSDFEKVNKKPKVTLILPRQENIPTLDGVDVFQRGIVPSDFEAKLDINGKKKAVKLIVMVQIGKKGNESFHAVSMIPTKDSPPRFALYNYGGELLNEVSLNPINMNFRDGRKSPSCELVHRRFKDPPPLVLSVIRVEVAE